MPISAIITSILFFPAIIAGNALLFWAYRSAQREGIWPTEPFFGFRRRQSFQLFNVISRLREGAQQTKDEPLAIHSRKVLLAIYLGNGLGNVCVASYGHLLCSYARCF